MQVSHVEKNMVEQSSTSTKENLNHTLGLTLSTRGLVIHLNFPIHFNVVRTINIVPRWLVKIVLPVLRYFYSIKPILDGCIFNYFG